MSLGAWGPGGLGANPKSTRSNERLGVGRCHPGVRPSAPGRRDRADAAGPAAPAAIALAGVPGSLPGCLASWWGRQ